MWNKNTAIKIKYNKCDKRKPKFSSDKIVKKCLCGINKFSTPNLHSRLQTNSAHKCLTVKKGQDFSVFLLMKSERQLCFAQFQKNVEFFSLRNVAFLLIGSKYKKINKSKMDVNEEKHSLGVF